MRLGGLIAIILAMSTPAPVAATVFIATFTGQVDAGVDGSGLFGAAGRDLTGEVIVASFKINTAAAGTSLRETATFSDLVGGRLFGQAGNAVAGLIMIGSQGRLAANDFGNIAVQRDEASVGGNDLFGATVYGSNFSGVGQRLEANVSSTDDSFVMSPRFGSAIDFVVPQGLIYFGSGATDASVFRSAVRLMVRSQSPVPEARSWLLLLIGWGIIGTVVRRQSLPKQAQRQARQPLLGRTINALGD